MGFVVGHVVGYLPSHIHNGSSRDMFEIVFQEMDDADLRSIDFNHFSHWVVTHMNNTTDKEIFETEMNANTRQMFIAKRTN